MAELVKTLEKGLGKMPKFEGKLSAAELKSVSEDTLELHCVAVRLVAVKIVEPDNRFGSKGTLWA